MLTAGRKYRVRARREVVLCAGAVQSPHILQLSGIGPQHHLREHQIPVIADLSGVGSGLMDHLCVPVIFEAKHHTTSSRFEKFPQVVGAVFQYYTGNEGSVLRSPAAEAGAFIRVDSGVYWDNGVLRDTASGTKAPHIEFVKIAGPMVDHAQTPGPSGDSFTILVTLLTPRSKGTIRLRDNNPTSHPKIDPEYLSMEQDIEMLVDGVLKAVEIAQKMAVVKDNGYCGWWEQQDTKGHKGIDRSRDEWKEFVREKSETLYHPTSSCRVITIG